jgi:polyhydroxybutyrate depolymerase
MRVVIIIAVLLSCFAGALFVSRTLSQIRRQSDDPEQVLQFGGLSRTFRLHVPPNYDKKKAVPLLFVLHGGSGSGGNMGRFTGFNEIADSKGFIVVYPDGYDRSWNDGRDTAKHKEIDDVGFIASLLDYATRTYNVDRHRVYATGISNGAFMSTRLACSLADRIAAIATVAGTMSEAIAPSCNPPRPVPVLMIHGTKDPLVPFEGGEIAGLFGLGQGGKTLSANGAAAKWAGHNKCSSNPQVSDLPDRDPRDGTTIKRSLFTHCDKDADVVLYTVVNGGHTWPGARQYLSERLIGKTSRDIDGSDIIWDFLSSKSLK